MGNGFSTKGKMKMKLDLRAPGFGALAGAQDYTTCATGGTVHN